MSGANITGIVTSISATCTDGTKLSPVTVPKSANYTITPGYDVSLNNEYSGLEALIDEGILDDYDFEQFELQIGANVTADSVGISDVGCPLTMPLQDHN